MHPRLESSKQWSPFPPEYSEKIREVFEQNYESQKGEGHFMVEGRIYPEEILLRVGFQQKSRLSQANFEGSLTYDPKKEKAQDRIGVLIDAIGAWFDHYFEEGQNDTADYPKHWEEYDFLEDVLFMQFSTVNTDLEAQANALLGSSEGTVFNEEDLSDDAMDHALVDSDLAKDIQKKIRSGHTVH